MMSHARHLIVLAALSLVACASAAPAEPSAGSSAAVTAAPDLTGRYAFALDESTPAATLRASCDAESGGDATASAECFAKIRAVAANEGIRFEKDADGRAVWVSYGAENGAEQIYHRCPVELLADSPRALTARTLAPATGLLASERPLAQGTLMRLEIVDATTIAMNDPSKGRLVFHRVATP